jgi:hypothetical protein
MLQEEFLKPLGLTAYRLAKDIGVPLTRIDYIVAGKRAVTAETQTVGSLTAPPKKQQRPLRALAFRGGEGGHQELFQIKALQHSIVLRYLSRYL